MEALNIIVPLVTAVLVAFITYFLTKSHYEQKRRDELADREFNRRAAIQDKRIQEARKYVEAFSFVINFMSHLVNIFDGESDMKSVHETINSFREDEVQELRSMGSVLLKNNGSITVLNDDELTTLGKELNLHYFPPLKKLVAIFDKFNEDADFEVRNINLRELSSLIGEAKEIVTKMKIRLDELARTVK